MSQRSASAPTQTHFALSSAQGGDREGRPLSYPESIYRTNLRAVLLPILVFSAIVGAAFCLPFI